MINHASIASTWPCVRCSLRFKSHLECGCRNLDLTHDDSHGWFNLCDWCKRLMQWIETSFTCETLISWILDRDRELCLSNDPTWGLVVVTSHHHIDHHPIGSRHSQGVFMLATARKQKDKCQSLDPVRSDGPGFEARSSLEFSECDDLPAVTATCTIIDPHKSVVFERAWERGTEHASAPRKRWLHLVCALPSSHHVCCTRGWGLHASSWLTHRSTSHCYGSCTYTHAHMRACAVHYTWRLHTRRKPMDSLTRVWDWLFIFLQDALLK